MTSFISNNHMISAQNYWEINRSARKNGKKEGKKEGGEEEGRGEGSDGGKEDFLEPHPSKPLPMVV